MFMLEGLSMLFRTLYRVHMEFSPTLLSTPGTFEYTFEGLFLPLCKRSEGQSNLLLIISTQKMEYLGSQLSMSLIRRFAWAL